MLHYILISRDESKVSKTSFGGGNHTHTYKPSLLLFLGHLTPPQIAFSLLNSSPKDSKAPFSSVIKTLLSPPCDWLCFNVLSLVEWVIMLRSKILQRD